jgi:hypothetical protein
LLTSETASTALVEGADSHVVSVVESALRKVGLRRPKKTRKGISIAGGQGCGRDVERKLEAEREARTRSALTNQMPRLAQGELDRQ